MSANIQHINIPKNIKLSKSAYASIFGNTSTNTITNNNSVNISTNRTITLTFGDRGENHVGNQCIGKLADDGFNRDDLIKIMQEFEKNGYFCELIKLNDKLPVEHVNNVEYAGVLVIRSAISNFVNAHELFNEMNSLNMDKKAKMRGKVVNKHARHNLCFSDYSQTAKYEDGKGTIIDFKSVPLLNKLRNKLPIMVGNKATNLICELNDYYDIRKCGIGFHGDTERKRVIGIRLGATIPLHYQWYHQCKPIGERTVINLNHGDIYIMSEKAVGSDWKKRSKITLRHAAGCEKYTTIKNK